MPEFTLKERMAMIKNGFCPEHPDKPINTTSCDRCKTGGTNKHHQNLKQQLANGKILYRKCKLCGEVKELNEQNYEKHKSVHEIAFHRLCMVCRDTHGYRLGKAENYITLYNNKKLGIKCGRPNFKAASAALNSRAKRYGAIGSINSLELEKLIEDYYGICSYCGEEAVLIDHIIPLTRGGTGNINNMVPCCHYCNNSKDNNILNIEWIAPIQVDLYNPGFADKFPRRNLNKTKVR